MTEMFSFERWRAWLAAKDQRELGAEFSPGKPSPKPGFAFSFRTNTVLSQIRIWNTGEADYEVMDLRSGEFIHNVAGLLLDDTTFEAAFEEFQRRTTEAK